MRKPLLWGSCAVFVLAFAVRIGMAAKSNYHHELFRFEMERGAITLAERGFLGDPFSAPTGPTAHLAPGYPILLAGIYNFVGTDTRAEFVKIALSSVVASTQYALLPLLSYSIGLSPWVGILAGCMGALVPFQIYTEAKGDWESVWTGLILVALMILIQRRTSPVLLGAVAGLGLLFSPTLLPFLVVLLVLTDLRKHALLIGGIAIAMTLPWSLRNYLAMGSFVWIRDNLGMELYLSNNDNSRPTMDENINSGTFQQTHPFFSKDEAGEVRRLGEVQYNSRRLQQAKEWITSHPGGFVRLTAARVYYFWIGGVRSMVKLAWRLGSTAAALFGMFVLWRKNPKAGAVFGLLWLAFPIIYYVIQFEARYRYPIEWSIYFLASVALITVASDRWSMNRMSRSDHARL